MRLTPEHVFCCMVDWVPLLTVEALHGASVQCGLALLDHALLLRKIHLEFLGSVFLQEEHSSNAGPTRADRMFRWLALSSSV